MHEKLAIVIPTYNERESIRRLILTLFEMFPMARVFVVDDNSPDGTAFIVQDLATENERVKLIWRESKQGLASAYLDAFARILPDESIEYVLTMDADFSHRPEDLGRLLEAALGHDLVIGSRYIEGGRVENWDPLRMFISKYANRYAGAVTGTPIQDLTAGFVVYHRNILGRILMNEIRSDAYGYQIEMKHHAYRAGARIKEVPITFRERKGGRSKFGWKSVWEGIVVPWYLRLFK